MWTLFEPVHAVTYFAPEARSAFEEAGLRGFWRGYFAGRAAPLGPAGAAVVGASFFNFAPAMVARGWIGPDGTLTAAGRDVLAMVEIATDQAAARPWACLGPAAVTRLAQALTPVAQACARVVPYPSPIGVPAPGTAGTPA
jgi:hypothetical protein